MNLRPRINEEEYKVLQAFRDSKEKEESRVLVCGDLHAPFTLDGYLEHCVDAYHKYKCNKVVFIGDILDNHFASFHTTDADGLGGGDELDLAIEMISKWYKVFPEAHVILGNHDRLVRRKVFEGGIPKRWVKEFGDVINTPKWIFTERLVIDNVQYIHGESGRATKKSKDDMMSTVQGHRHTEMFTEYSVGSNYKIFGCAVGCGVDNTSYAMAYGKHFKKPAIGCAVIFKGEYALNVPMDL
jgi:metallophosphoesterase superfamily enzyme